MRNLLACREGEPVLGDERVRSLRKTARSFPRPPGNTWEAERRKAVPHKMAGQCSLRRISCWLQGAASLSGSKPHALS